MDLIPTLIYCSYYGSFEEFINYSNTHFSFTTCNSVKKLLLKDNKEVNRLDNLFWRNYCFTLLDWYEKQKCAYVFVKSYRKMKLKMFLELRDNVFHSAETKDKFLITFMKLQKTYMAFNRLAYLWKYKHATTSVTTDLYLDTIDPTKDSTFVLYQNNTKFTFKISELIRIIGLALYGKYEGSFHISSELPSNPYNKMNFEIHNLYNIYFHIAFHTKMNMPTIIHLWFKEDFICSKLILKHKPVLQKLCVQNFVTNLDYRSPEIHYHMTDIIQTNKYLCKWKIDPTFPKKDLLDKLKPCMFDYYMAEYVNCSTDESVYYRINLRCKLKRLYLENPIYGTIDKKLFDNNGDTFRFDLNIDAKPFIFGEKSSNIVINPHKCNKKVKRINKSRSSKEGTKLRSYREYTSNSKYKRDIYNDFSDDSLRAEAQTEILNLRKKCITVDDTIRMGFVNDTMAHNTISTLNLQIEDDVITISSLFT